MMSIQHFKSFFSRNNIIYNYCADLWALAVESAFLLAFTAVFNYLFLYGIKMFWLSYASTPVGDLFLRKSGERVRFIFKLINCDILELAINLTLAAFLVCLIISAVCQLLHVIRHFYMHRGLPGKLVYWGLPMAGFVAYYLGYLYQFDKWGGLYLIALLPTLLVFMLCFKIAEKLLPELGFVINKVYYSLSVLSITLASCRKDNSERSS
jgi:hypothetical protein